MDALVRRQEIVSGDEKHRQCLTLVDATAQYITNAAGEIPDRCVERLQAATKAAYEQDLPVFVRELDGALWALELSQNPQYRYNPKAKPMKKHTDELLQKLKRTKAPTS